MYNSILVNPKRVVSSCRYPDEFESTRIIGDRQFKKAVDLFNSASEQVKGRVDYRHKYIDFSQLKVTIGDQVVKTCPAAMGFAFAAGTTDGPGAFDFTQGDDKVGGIDSTGNHRLSLNLINYVNFSWFLFAGESLLEVGEECTENTQPGAG